MRRLRVRLLYFLLAIAATALLAALFARVTRIRANSNESVCLGHIFYLGAELIQYRDTHGRFPPVVIAGPAGRPLHSWRALLFADIDRDFASRYTFNEPWDSPANLRAARAMPSVFACPNNQDDPAKFTSYAAIIGRGTTSLSPKGLGPPGGGPQILLIEVPESTITWTEPRDINLAEIASLAPSRDPGGLSVVFTDGRVRRLSRDAILDFLNRP